MEIKHLQSLIKRNSDHINSLEEFVVDCSLYGYHAEKTTIKTRKQIKALAELQRALKNEIANEIFCMRVDAQYEKFGDLHRAARNT